MIKSRLAVDVRIFAKCEFIYENAKTKLRSFTTFEKQYLIKSIRYTLRKKKKKNAKENVHAFATFAKGFLGLARA